MAECNITLDACLCIFDSGSARARWARAKPQTIRGPLCYYPINYLKKFYRLRTWRKLPAVLWRLELFCCYSRWGGFFKANFASRANQLCAATGEVGGDYSVHAGYSTSPPPPGSDPGSKTPRTVRLGESPKVLLVEDNEMVQFVHKSMLNLLGCWVDIAATGHQALAMVATKVYDIILLDIGLPDISGIEVAQELRARGLTRSTRLIALTTHADPKACFAAGIEQVAIKPLDLEEFKRLIYQRR